MVLARVVLVAATVTSGLLAGVYLFYAHTVMPAVRALPDRPAVDTFAALDRRIVNPVFMATAFLGAPVLTATALAMSWNQPTRWWVAAALVLHLVATVVTARVHLPRNAAATAQAAGDERYSATTARVALDEPTWARWNLVRVTASVAALTALAWALTLA
ncbi:anthrone oxygenase family protein [Oryzobacter telluris]|uniref:anthrone oxygenase family protein n=1 Tax=Oryzobacter telluris TaxID=3149179 RepID=UPI00370DCCAC